MLYDNTDGREVRRRMGVWIYTLLTGTITTLLISHNPIQNKKFNKKCLTKTVTIDNRFRVKSQNRHRDLSQLNIYGDGAMGN